MTDVDAELRPWFDRLGPTSRGLELYDAHTHVGRNDPDGMKQEPEELLAGLAAVDARGHRLPDARARRLPARQRRRARGRRGVRQALVAFCRVNPHDGAVAEAERCLDAGARGIKLHPRAERFTFQARRARISWRSRTSARCRCWSMPGRGIPALGRDTVALSGEFPDATLILAHCRRVRPRLAVARAARAPEPVHRHRVVAAGRPDRDVRARAAGQRRVGQRLALRVAAAVRGDGAALRAAGGPGLRAGARGGGRPARAGARRRGSPPTSARRRERRRGRRTRSRRAWPAT